MSSPLPWLRTLFLNQNAQNVAKLSQAVANRCLGLAVDALSHAPGRDESYLRGYVRAYVSAAICRETTRIAPPDELQAEVIIEATGRLIDMAIEAGARLKARSNGLAAAA